MAIASDTNASPSWQSSWADQSFRCNSDAHYGMIKRSLHATRQRNEERPGNCSCRRRCDRRETLGGRKLTSQLPMLLKLRSLIRDTTRRRVPRCQRTDPPAEGYLTWSSGGPDVSNCTRNERFRPKKRAAQQGHRSTWATIPACYTAGRQAPGGPSVACARQCSLPEPGPNSIRRDRSYG